MDNKTLKLHSLIPKLFNSQNNANWKAVIGAIGEQDQATADLIEEVRKQAFIKTASRPYLDRLGSNYGVNRPKFIGMTDTSFKKYIPILAYTPKQVKNIIDQLLDLFFNRESTTSHIISSGFQPFNLIDGWTLKYKVDGLYDELIQFNVNDFININSATADEVASIINRQALKSFAISYYDSITKNTYIKIFTKTIGSKGSIQITGGYSNLQFKFDGFIFNAGNGADTEWTVTKIGDTVRFTFTSGTDPNIENILIDDLLICNLPFSNPNNGSFNIDSVNSGEKYFTVKNIFGEAGIFTQNSSDNIKFIRNSPISIFKNDKRAIVWEIGNKISVEMPATPPIVRRVLKGSAHLNGQMSQMINYIDKNTIEINDIDNWPNNGKFTILPKLDMYVKNNSDIVIDSIVGKYNNSIIYEFNGKSGNNLINISPDLPLKAANYQVNITNITNNSGEILIECDSNHNFVINDIVLINGVTVSGSDADINGLYHISEIIDDTHFKYITSSTTLIFDNNGIARVEKYGLSNNGSIIFLRSAQTNTGILGPYLWDKNAPYTMSSLSAKTLDNIKIGDSGNIIRIGTNSIINQDGFILFDFGTNNQEGPIRYLYKPSDNTIFLDPSYFFKKDHLIGSDISMLRYKGAPKIDTIGTQYPFYITDPSIARTTLQNLITSIKSTGIFIDFIIRYPENIYNFLDIYNSGINPNIIILEYRGII